MSSSTSKAPSTEFDAKYGILNLNTPPRSPMCGRYKQSFAYYTLRSRLPVTLTSIIDSITKDKDELISKYGEDSREEIKNIIGSISKLKYQLQTDKALEPFEGNEPDIEIWNSFIQNMDEENNSFFKTCWLYAECYMYRRLSSFFENSKTLKSFDYFAKQKQNALINSVVCIEEILNVLQGIEITYDSFRLMIKLNLWGNRCDLSITSGKQVQLGNNPFDLIRSFDNKILIDNSKSVFECLKSTNSNKPAVVEFVCDNAGYELFTDFVLADYLIKSKLVEKVRFNLKAIPWFVSDATINDLNWTLYYLQNHSIPILKEYGERWQELLNDKKFEIAPLDYFWTSPYEYYRMCNINPELYQKLSESRLVIFKGDLNYRKLIGDFSWSCTEQFITCLRGFLPTDFVSLRTVKADLICGLLEGQAEKVFELDQNWMTTGEYGTIQFISKPTIYDKAAITSSLSME
ncbi:damage-control phosphatase ARMT1-like isoform X1 [Bactrocera neohumeralis]|uniref:damage-control phosphatase ARMT1-like isoform X1 n=1 Tax=Bactrocera neohumeralis TaxID=98809 RepID=UPI002166B7A1|nr:damage-control phosphatase ARMT1-like isoform X1 [Bactrocera neohumeralis]